MDVFIIGSKGIPARYGGFETFVDNLVSRKVNQKIKYHVSCNGKVDSEFEYKGARCFNVSIPDIGSAKAVLYDLKSLWLCLKYIKKNDCIDSIIYILACRIGPFLYAFKLLFKKYGIRIFINPDGNEWKRDKWNKVIKAYWKFSEKLSVKHSNLLICDSECIVKYIKNEYTKYNPSTVFIPYGADLTASELSDDSDSFHKWCAKTSVSPGEYFLVVGRFVKENNFETIIREFMDSVTSKPLVIISNVEKNKFFEELVIKTGFDKDPRVIFAGTVYEVQLLKKIREKAFAYIHGHEVGGTNPSLLEALASTKINILINVEFNMEVGQNATFYFNKQSCSLKRAIELSEQLKYQEIDSYSKKCKNRISEQYSWERIIINYEMLWSKQKNNIF